MKTSILEQNAIDKNVVELVRRLVDMIPWPTRRQAKADVINTLLDGKPRAAEDAFGWARSTTEMGVKEVHSGVTCMNDISKRRKPRTEDKNPQLMADIRQIADSSSHAQESLRTPYSYMNITAASVRNALLEKGWKDEEIPAERTLANILNRNNYRLRRVVKTQVQKN